MPILELERNERAQPHRIFGNSTDPLSQKPFGPLRRTSLYAALALLTLLVHGYHPFAEDGGLYAAGVESLLNPKLFPHYTAFATEHLRFSLFAPAVAALVRGSSLSLEWALLLLYLGCAALTFAAVDRLLERLGFSFQSRLGGLLLLFAWWTLPIAGTSLFLEDPYLTARSVSTPLALWAICFALDSRSFPARGLPWRWGWCATCFLGAFAFHPLMAGYAFCLVLCLLAVRAEHKVRFCFACAAGALLLAGFVQWHGTPESPAMIAAALSRYYWFLSRWQWYELFGLAGPMLVLLALDRSGGDYLPPASRVLIHACYLLGGISILVTAVYAHTGSATHAVARLQPLRAFLMIYIVMTVLLGSVAASWWKTFSGGWSVRSTGLQATPALGVGLLAFILYDVQRAAFPASQHLETPGRMEHSPNPWVQAFFWARTHTAPDDLFAIDAHYITQSGEDAQTFRAIAQRSILPDYSKDGGEAAITPGLAAQWRAGEQAQTGLNTLDDAERAVRLRPYSVDWVVLSSRTPTARPCPYDNLSIKICPL